MAAFLMLSLRGRTICCKVFCQIGDRIAGNLHGCGAPRRAGSKLRVDASGVVHKVGVKSGGPDLIFVEVAGQLVDDGPYHFQVSELFGSDIRAKIAHFKS